MLLRKVNGIMVVGNCKGKFYYVRRILCIGHVRVHLRPQLHDVNYNFKQFAILFVCSKTENCKLIRNTNAMNQNKMNVCFVVFKKKNSFCKVLIIYCAHDSWWHKLQLLFNFCDLWNKCKNNRELLILFVENLIKWTTNFNTINWNYKRISNFIFTKIEGSMLAIGENTMRFLYIP